MNHRIIIGCVSILIFTGCLRLDDYLFNPKKVDAYLLDKYTGEVDFQLPSSYDLADSLIHWIPLTSTGHGSEVHIQGLFIGDLHTITSDTIILYCHGNRDHLDHYWPRIQLLASHLQGNRFSVLAMDYQGYGMSEGEPSQQGTINDAFSALNWLLGQGVDPGKVIVYGFSLGSIPAVALAGSEQLSGRGGLVLEAPLASSEALIQDGSTLSLPAGFLTDLDFDNVAGMDYISQPFLWMHGESDQTTAIRSHGEPVFQAYKGVRSTALRIADGGHTNLPILIGYDIYLSGVHGLLTQ